MSAPSIARHAGAAAFRCVVGSLACGIIHLADEESAFAPSYNQSIPSRGTASRTLRAVHCG